VSTQHPHPYGPYPTAYAPPAPRNGLGTAALILGLVGLPFFLTGLTAPIAIILGLIAVPLAMAGLGRARRREATNRGAAVTGLVLGLLAIMLGIWSIVVTVQAVGEVFDGPTATVTSSGGEATQPAGPLALGTTVDVDGLAVTVNKIVTTQGSFGDLLHCADVTYENRGTDRASRNPYDWSARNAQGASVSHRTYTGSNALDSGDLAPGGTDSGLVCFDVPRDEVAVVEYTSSLFDDGPAAEWATR
jgi:hypothetical protein